MRSRGSVATWAMAAAIAVGSVAAIYAATREGEMAQEPQRERILGESRGRFHKAGWNHYGPGYFELEPETGILKSYGGMGLFWYAVKEYEDFVLELEFMCDKAETNSGVFVRVPGVPTSDDYIYHSFEIQINDAGEGIHQTGAVYDAEAPTAQAWKPTGEWNQFRITLRGNHITIELNGQRIVEWEMEPRGKVRDLAPRGYIGLQNHDYDTSVYFRNIFVTELP